MTDISRDDRHERSISNDLVRAEEWLGSALHDCEAGRHTSESTVGIAQTYALLALVEAVERLTDELDRWHQYQAEKQGPLADHGR